jgi:hypothetical protein
MLIVSPIKRLNGDKCGWKTSHHLIQMVMKGENSRVVFLPRFLEGDKETPRVTVPAGMLLH